MTEMLLKPALTVLATWGFPGGQRLKPLPGMQETWSDPLSGKIPGEEMWQPIEYSLGESHGGRAVGYSPRGCELT